MTELAQAFDEFVKTRIGGGIIPAKVSAVDAAALTCDVTDTDGNEIFDVRLRAAIDLEQDGVAYLPKLDTWVLIGQVGHQENTWCVVMWSEVTLFKWEVAPVIFRVDEEGFLIEKSGDTLAEIEADLVDALTDLTDAIQLLTVTCAAPGSPSTPPVNVASFAAVGATLTALKTRFNSLLKAV